MQLLIFGPGRLGGAIAGAATAAGWPPPVLAGSPGSGQRPAILPRADVVIEASAGPAVTDNLAKSLAAGHRLFVLAATGWDADAAASSDRSCWRTMPRLSSRRTCRSGQLCSRGWSRLRPAGTRVPATSSPRSWSGTGAARPIARPGTARALARRIVGRRPPLVRRAGPRPSGPGGARRPRRSRTRHTPRHVRRPR